MIVLPFFSGGRSVTDEISRKITPTTSEPLLSWYDVLLTSFLPLSLFLDFVLLRGFPLAASEGVGLVLLALLLVLSSASSSSVSPKSRDSGSSSAELGLGD
jgi:hypothetical protein